MRSYGKERVNESVSEGGSGKECVCDSEREMMDHIRSLKILMIELSAIDPNLVLHFSVSSFIIFSRLTWVER